MSDYKQSMHTLSICKNPRDGFYTLRTNDLSPLLFCSGNCDEATSFEQLCSACLNEWYEYEKEKA